MSSNKNVFDYKRKTYNTANNFDNHRKVIHTAIDYSSINPIVTIACKLAVDLGVLAIKSILDDMNEKNILHQTKQSKKKRKVKSKKGK